MTEHYLGDGLYASFDGFQLALRAPREDGGDHVVFLEPQVFRSLLEFAKRTPLAGLLEAQATASVGQFTATDMLKANSLEPES